MDRVTGKRVVVSLDGGRVRVRRKKRGPKTKKGRNRFHTDWKEPKLLILYVVGDDGRPSQTWHPCSATYRIALSTCRLGMLTLPRCRGRQDAMGAYCVSVSSIQERYHDPANSVNTP